MTVWYVRSFHGFVKQKVQALDFTIKTHLCRGTPTCQVTLWLSHFSVNHEYWLLLIIIIFSREQVFRNTNLLYCLKLKCYYQNDRMDRGIISWFRPQNSFTWRNVTKKIPKVEFPLFKLLYGWVISLWIMNNDYFFLFLLISWNIPPPLPRHVTPAWYGGGGGGSPPPGWCGGAGGGYTPLGWCGGGGGRRTKRNDL